NEPLGPSRLLFRDLHRLDPGAAGRLADGLVALPEVGDRIAGFRLLAELGRGAFGRVFLARQGRLADPPVALKVAPPVGRKSRAPTQPPPPHTVPIHSAPRAGRLQAACIPYFGRTPLLDVLRDLRSRPALPARGGELFRLGRSQESAEDPLTPATARN